MNGPELLQALMDAAGDNAHGIAVRLKQPSLQSYIWKFTNGKAKEPRRSSLMPLAEHYRVPLEAFYDQTLADQVAAERGLTGTSPTSQPSGAAPRPAGDLEAALHVLAGAMSRASRTTRIAVGPLLAAMATDPDDAKNQSELILKLLVTNADIPNKPPHDEMSRSHIYVKTGPLTLGDENGRRDTDTSTGTREK